MNIFSFTAHFDSEEACRLLFKSERDKIGVECQRCGQNEHYWIKAVWSYECKSCRGRTSLRCETIMQSSKLSFLVWYKAMFLLTITKKGFSSKEIQKQLELHIMEKYNRETTKGTLKWVHITISNVKRNLLGNYHRIKGKYLQLYLNEFVYKLNRRHFCDRLIIANITGLWVKTNIQF